MSKPLHVCGHLVKKKKKKKKKKKTATVHTSFYLLVKTSIGIKPVVPVKLMIPRVAIIIISDRYCIAY